MSNVHFLHGSVQAQPATRIRGPYRKKVTAAEIARAVDTARKVGLTIYGVTIDGERIHLQTRPAVDADGAKTTAADVWFARHG